MKGAFLAVGE